jgi:hypothetical protein
MDRKRGHYLGTEIDERWWHRYTRDGLLARGMGEYWYDDQAFYFLRHLSRVPVVIPFVKMEGLKVGTWHAGRWAWGRPIVKLLWIHRGRSLSSGFVLSASMPEVEQLIEDLRRHMPFPGDPSA